MEETPLTPKLLREKGFEERLMFGNITFVKNKVAVVYNLFWHPCNMETGQLLTSQNPVGTYEQLERVVREGGLTI